MPERNFLCSFHLSIGGRGLGLRPCPPASLPLKPTFSEWARERAARVRRGERVPCKVEPSINCLAMSHDLTCKACYEDATTGSIGPNGGIPPGEVCI